MSPSFWLLWSVLVALVHTVPSISGLKLGSFNVQVFGKKKSSNQEVMNIISKVVKRYDIILIQEIRDKSGKAIRKLLAQVNTKGQQYEMVISDRLGRTSSKEQYAFLYRTGSGIQIMDTYHYSDPGDKFEREPYVIRVKTTRTAGVAEFALVALHADPDTALEEINLVPKVVQDIRQTWSLANVIIMGDLNADCRYASKSGLSNSPLRTSQFHWLIPDDADTTVGATDCAYDRLIVSGNSLMGIVKNGASDVFYFDKEFGLDSEQALAVSDHYPVEMELKERETHWSTPVYTTDGGSSSVYRHRSTSDKMHESATVTSESASRSEEGLLTNIGKKIKKLSKKVFGEL